MHRSRASTSEGAPTRSSSRPSSRTASISCIPSRITRTRHPAVGSSGGGAEPASRDTEATPHVHTRWLVRIQTMSTEAVASGVWSCDSERAPAPAPAAQEMLQASPRSLAHSP